MQEEVVCRVLCAGVGRVEAERQGAVEHVGQRDEGICWCREVEEQEGCDGLDGVSFALAGNAWNYSRCSPGRIQCRCGTWSMPSTHLRCSGEAAPPPGRCGDPARC